MKSPEPSTDKVYAHAHYTLHHRSARRARWSYEARPHYGVLFLLKGSLRWNVRGGETSEGDTHTSERRETDPHDGQRHQGARRGGEQRATDPHGGDAISTSSGVARAQLRKGVAASSRRESTREAAVGRDDAGEFQERGVLFVNPGDAAQAQGEQTEYLTLTLAPAFMLDCAVRARLTRADARITFRACAAAAEDERLNALARDLAEELGEERAGQELMIAALVEQLVLHLLRRHANIRRSDELELSRVGLVDRRIRRAVELMHAHLERDLPLDALADAAHLSPFHFARLFKKLTGASPHAYLATLRAARAQTLLSGTDLSITQIGARVGYSSSSHFAKAFRQATGLSPRAFRAALVRR